MVRLTTLHASGLPMVASTLIRHGRSLGRKEQTVMGESTSLDMLLDDAMSEGQVSGKKKKGLARVPPIADAFMGRDHTQEQEEEEDGGTTVLQYCTAKERTCSSDFFFFFFGKRYI